MPKQTVIPSGYTAADRARIFGPLGNRTPEQAGAERKAYRKAKKAACRALSKARKKPQPQQGKKRK